MISEENSFNLAPKWHCPDAGKYAFTFITLLIFLIIIYGNSFHCAWHFDDFPNIVDNTNVHLETLSWKNIKRTFYGIFDGREEVTRPLSYLTFALNYHVGGTNVFGYHVVNFVIHYISSVFLFLLIYNTLKLPLLRDRFENRAYSIALLSVFVWTTHPIQVTAVTYIVQRMASMSAMFYIMAMYLYLKGRISSNGKKKAGFFALCGVTAVLSFASKENSAMLPISLFLYELVLISGVTKQAVKNGLKIIIPFILMVLVLILFYGDFSSLLDAYKHRPFTLAERLLTEPRVIIFYLTLLLYPTTSRVSLLHHVEISESLFTPWATFPSIMAIFLFLGIALWALRKRPLIAYCILFFFLNHLIEGSIFPLELIFEHRNYLPSTFLFLLPSLFAVHVLDYFSYRRSIQTCVGAVIVLLLVSHGHTSYLRNRVLKTEITLWSDVVKKAPALSRPHINLSNALFRAGRTPEAFVLLNKAKDAKPGPNPRSKALPAHNLGHYYLAVGEIDKSMSLFKEALGLDPSTAQAYHGLGKAMFFKGLLEDAEKNIRTAISLEPNSALFHRSLSVILLRAGRVNAAMKAAVRAMQLDHTLDEPFYILGEAYRIKKLWRKAAYYFEEFIKRRPGSLHAHIALIEIYGEIGEMSQVKQHAFALMAGKGRRGLMDVLLEFDSQINFLDSARVNTVLAFVRMCLKEEAQGLKAIHSPTQKRHGSNNWHQPLLQGPAPLSPTQP